MKITPEAVRMLQIAGLIAGCGGCISHSYDPAPERIEQLRKETQRRQEYDRLEEAKGYPRGSVKGLFATSRGLFVDRVVLGPDKKRELWRFTDVTGAALTSGAHLEFPGAFPVWDVAEDRTRGEIFFAARSGVHCTKDAGRSWEKREADLEHGFTANVCVDERRGRLYCRVVEDGFGVYASSAGEGKWTPIWDGLPKRTIVTALAYSEKDDALYCVAGLEGVIVEDAAPYLRNAGVYRLPQSGKSSRWTTEKGLPFSRHFSPVQCLTVDDRGALYACAINGVYKRETGRWVRELACEFAWRLIVERETGAAAVVTFFESDLYVRKDEESPWARIRWPTADMTLWSVCAWRGHLFLSSNDGLWTYRFADPGLSWKRIEIDFSESARTADAR